MFPLLNMQLETNTLPAKRRLISHQNYTENAIINVRGITKKGADKDDNQIISYFSARAR